jgi:hypothetical protein
VAAGAVLLPDEPQIVREPWPPPDPPDPPPQEAPGGLAAAPSAADAQRSGPIIE